MYIDITFRKEWNKTNHATCFCSLLDKVQCIEDIPEGLKRCGSNKQNKIKTTGKQE
jgi:hypothetical protein